MPAKEIDPLVVGFGSTTKLMLAARPGGARRQSPSSDENKASDFMLCFISHSSIFLPIRISTFYACKASIFLVFRQAGTPNLS
jgi:hypothetical protein